MTITYTDLRYVAQFVACVLGAVLFAYIAGAQLDGNETTNAWVAVRLVVLIMSALASLGCIAAAGITVPMVFDRKMR